VFVEGSLSTDQKGNIAEAAVTRAALSEGIHVYRPFGEGGRYDLILDLPSGLSRVQCKWAPRQGGVVVVRCCSARRSRAGVRYRTYCDSEVDAFAAYCPDTDRCYYLPAPLVVNRRQIQLRLGPSKNNQRIGIVWARLYEFSAIDWDYLAASWGCSSGEERSAGSRKGVGSNPTSSTLITAGERPVGAEEFRTRLGEYMQRAAAGEEMLITRRGKPLVRLSPAERGSLAGTKPLSGVLSTPGAQPAHAATRSAIAGA
jgi:prevent-host-death family protein